MKYRLPAKMVLPKQEDVEKVDRETKIAKKESYGDSV